MSQKGLIDSYIASGNKHFWAGRYDEALRWYRKALTIDRQCAAAYYNIGNILALRSRYEPAERHLKEALRINPQWPEALNNLGNALKEQGKISEAKAAYLSAINLNPLMADPYNGLGNVLQAEGLIREAINAYSKAIELRPDYSIAHSNMLLALNYSPDYEPEAIFNAHKLFGNRYESPGENKQSIKLPASRSIRIAYISPDFRRHSVGSFIKPVLECYDREVFEVLCYSDVSVPDFFTEMLRSHTDHWVDVCSMDNTALFKQIKNDAPDILIDLAGHSGYNRLELFAKRPVQKQISWIGYPNTTGLLSMDYRIVDYYTDPEGMTDKYNTETLLRMPGCFLCYSPPEDMPEVRGSPCLRNGYITFGSMNNLAKTNDLTLDLWADALKQNKGSKMLIKSKALNDVDLKCRLIDRFRARGIEEGRLEFIGFVKDYKAHLEVYNRIDIALDTFPYNGTTTTFEALLMGVPVVTLAGNTHASRVSLSILSNLGLPNLVADSPVRYIDIARMLSSDMDLLNKMRLSIRQMLIGSVLTDKGRYTRNFEHLLLNNIIGCRY